MKFWIPCCLPLFLASANLLHAQAPSYIKDVRPILDRYCVECHQGNKAKAGVRLDSFESILKGSKKGRKIVVAGQADKSQLVTCVEGTGGKKMPPKKASKQPTVKEVSILRDWVNSGAKEDTAKESPPGKSAKDEQAKTEEAAKLGVEAVIYGLPLVVVDMTKRVQTNVEEPQQNGHAPVNQFSHFLKYPTAAYKDVVRINVDTLYSFAWIDVSKEPIILSVPDTDGRYYLMPIIDAWTNVFASPGKRTTGTKAGHFAIVGPNWKGTLPDGVKELKATTNIAIIAGRTQANGPADYEVVHAIQKQYKLTPLSAFGKAYTPPKGVIDPKLDTKTPPVEQVSKMSADQFFKTLATLLKENPPPAADAPILAKLAKIGIVPGQDFDMSKLDSATAKGLEKSVQITLAKLQDAAKKTGKPVNGWQIPPMNLANFGTAYGERAVVALIGLGANLSQDAVYPSAYVDGNGKPLTGKKRYVIHFDKGQMPPAKAFWSITMYNAESFLVDNPMNRYNLAAWMPLKYNDDGSLDLYLQKDSQGKDNEANWLPAPDGAFNVTMRIYWPEESVLSGKWQPPAVKLAK